MFKSAKRIMRNVKCLVTPRTEKLDYLGNKIYDYYYTIFQSRLLPQTKDEVSIPNFLLKEKVRNLAYSRAVYELQKVVNECRVDECYKNALK